MEKGSGLLVHISSLPSKHGIGTFGKEAFAFVRFLEKAKQKYWQLLPLNPTGYGDSPYQSFSAFAINPYFIDLDLLVKQGMLTKEEVKKIKGGTNRLFVDYGVVYQERFDILRLAYHRGYETLKDKVAKFYKKNKVWLEDYAMFMTIKKLHNDVCWLEWKRDYRLHKRKAVQKAKEENFEEYNFWIFIQYLAFTQYQRLKTYAKRHGVKIIGDMPIYVSLDSADVWGNAKLFQLDSSRRPTKVAGVPPDFFSATGQLWGNPIYDYEKCRKTNYLWWRRRVKCMSKLYDLLRIDHFRGFEAYWAIPYGEETAINGQWVKGPGLELFEAIKKDAGNLQIIAEDLGVITKEVRMLKKATGFPGLKIFQFAFDDYYRCLSMNTTHNEWGEEVPIPQDVYADPKRLKEARLTNSFLPHNYENNCIAYIGTHDNDVITNFIDEHQDQIPAMMDYLGIQDSQYLIDTMIGSLMRSNADVVIFQIQDLLKLDKYSRMNTPGTAIGNWQFRIDKKKLTKEFAEHLACMVDEAKR